MSFFVWVFRLLLFVFLFGLAVKNSQTIEIRFFFDQTLTAPLSFVLLGTFAAGTALGVTVSLLTLVKQRRELARLKRLGQ